MLTRLEVPNEFNRNAESVSALGSENTGQQLIELAMRESGKASLEDVEVLDVGCGVRFTQTFINRSIPIGSYTGVEVYLPIVDYLKSEVEAVDSRFRFAHLDVYNALYNSKGSQSLSKLERLPVGDKFDQIWLFSVFTHLNAEDAEAMLRLLRKHIRPSGMLLFSAFIDSDLEGFEDRSPKSPLTKAYFGLKTMKEMIMQAGWSLEGFYKWDDHYHQLPIVDYFVCLPKE